MINNGTVMMGIQYFFPSHAPSSVHITIGTIIFSPNCRISVKDWKTFR